MRATELFMTSRTLKPGSLEGPGGVPRIPVLPPSQSDLKQVANKFAWKIPWTEEPGRLRSPWGC